MGLHARRPLLDLCFFYYNIKKLEKIIYKIPSVVGWIIAPQRYPCPNPQEITKSSNSWLWSPCHGWVWSRQNRIGGEQCKINTGPVTTAQAWVHLHRASWSLESSPVTTPWGDAEALAGSHLFPHWAPWVRSPSEGTHPLSSQWRISTYKATLKMSSQSEITKHVRNNPPWVKVDRHKRPKIRSLR